MKKQILKQALVVTLSLTTLLSYSTIGYAEDVSGADRVHNQVAAYATCEACEGTGHIETAEAEEESTCTDCGGSGKVAVMRDCTGAFVKVDENCIAPTTEAEGSDYYACETCGANYQVPVAKLEAPEVCTSPLHDQKNDVHKTRITFYNEDGKSLKTKTFGSARTYISVPTETVYSTATFKDEDGKYHYFAGWYDRDGKKYTSTYYQASETECQDIEAYPRWDVKDPCTDPLHDQETNQHHTQVSFVDTKTGEVVKEFDFTQGSQFKLYFQEVTKLLGLTKNGMYYNIGQKCVTDNGEYTFKGWFFDEEGTQPVSYSKTDISDPNCRIENSSYASKEECEAITIYAVYDVQCACTDALHDTKRNEHRTSIVFIDSYEEDGEELWHKEYNRTTIPENTSVKIGSVQDFTSGLRTHDDGIYYYRFEGWYDEGGNKLAGDFGEYTHDGITDRAFIFDEPVKANASNTECQEYKFYARWTKHKAAILNFAVIDHVTPFGMSFENTNAQISSFTHTFGNPAEVNKKAAAGYKFYGFVEYVDDVDEDGNAVTKEVAYQPGDVYTVDMTELADDSRNEKKVYAKWQPSVTVNYIADDETVATTGEMYEDYSVAASAPEAPSKSGYRFVGWVDENGDPIDEVKALGIITTGDRVEPQVVNVYAKYQRILLPGSDPQPLPDDDPLENPDDPVIGPLPLPDDDPLEDPGQQPLPEDEYLTDAPDETDAEAPADPDQPKTGDEAPLMGLTAMMLVSAGALGAICIRRKKEE